jgi:hypothetical protein
MTLPLDAYATSPREERMLFAAQQVVFAKCAIGASAENPATVEAARQTLALAPDLDHWIFGLWDVPFVAAHGNIGPPSQVPLGGKIKVDPNKGRECVKSPEYAGYVPMDFTHVPFPPEGARLFGFYQEALGQTYADPRFVALLTKRKACLTGQGYRIDSNSEYGDVDTSAITSSEGILKVHLAMAKCSDDLGFQQQAGDIFATYQQLLIDAHQAELVAVKKNSDERVAKASALLRTIGLA